MGALRESSIRVDPGRIRDNSSVDDQQRGFSSWAVRHDGCYDRARFKMFQFQDLLANRHHFRSSLSRSGPSAQNASDSRAQPCAQVMDSFPRIQVLRTDPASDVVTLLRHVNRSKPEVLYFDCDPMIF